MKNFSLKQLRSYSMKKRILWNLSKKIKKQRDTSLGALATTFKNFVRDFLTTNFSTRKNY